MTIILEMMETDRQENRTRFETIEDTVETLLKQNRSPGGNFHHVAEGHSSGSGYTNPPPFQVRNVKLDFPCFDCSEVLQWIFKAEQFFDYYNTPYAQRITISAIHMEKEVIHWFQMTNRATPFHYWIDFTRALELEFSPSPYECSRSQLFKLTQVTSVHDYYTHLTALANRVQGVTSEALIDCFVGGLKPDIQRDVIAQAPTTLIRCVSLAKLYEEKYTSKTKPLHDPYPFRHPQTNTASSQSIKSTSLPPLLQAPITTTFPKQGSVKKISPAEM